ncbi:unannotated protein [freshwater metagenome]|uniref:Unannotated protein n=1 Tax=freshwater metagenome TaxID=449393 RepID=A0A6J7QM59_9ZZZZ
MRSSATRSTRYACASSCRVHWQFQCWSSRWFQRCSSPSASGWPLPSRPPWWRGAPGPFTTQRGSMPVTAPRPWTLSSAWVCWPPGSGARGLSSSGVRAGPTTPCRSSGWCRAAATAAPWPMPCQRRTCISKSPPPCRCLSSPAAGSNCAPSRTAAQPCARCWRWGPRMRLSSTAPTQLPERAVARSRSRHPRSAWATCSWCALARPSLPMRWYYSESPQLMRQCSRVSLCPSRSNPVRRSPGPPSTSAVGWWCARSEWASTRGSPRWAGSSPPHRTRRPRCSAWLTAFRRCSFRWSSGSRC